LVAQPDGQADGEVAADRMAAAGDLVASVTLGEQPAVGRLDVVLLSGELILW
jgi:hypothetical protein